MFEVGDMIRYKYSRAGTNDHDTVIVTEVDKFGEGVYGECINDPVDIVGYSNRFISITHFGYWEKL